MSTTAHPDSFRARSVLDVGDRRLTIFRLSALEGADRLPYSVKILLENLLRHEDGVKVSADDVRSVAAWRAMPDGGTGRAGGAEIAFSPERVLMQDFTGVPAVVDL